mmetsp:Transcript_7950/g.23964  ORF Transcript_7950/g.23964 Transcript_7950/m.23964 type:complete len:328 (+) Transcript_7950:160-1143(+)
MGTVRMCGVVGGLVLVVGLLVARSTAQCEGPAKTFVMGFMGHTGSSAVMSTLFRHSDLETNAFMEPLTWRRLGDVPATERARELFDAAIDVGAVGGFKVRPSTGFNDKAGWTKIIEEYGTRYIEMTRSQLLKKAVGLYTIRAFQRRDAVQGVPSQDREEHCKVYPEVCRFRIDNVFFLAYLMHHSNNTNVQVRRLTKELPWECVLRVTYEDYLADTAGTMNKIYDFLGIQREDLEPKFAKAIPDNMCEVVENYQQVCARLWGCEQFRPMLEDPEHKCFCEDKSLPREDVLCDFEGLKQQVHHPIGQRRQRRQPGGAVSSVVETFFYK